MRWPLIEFPITNPVLIPSSALRYEYWEWAKQRYRPAILRSGDRVIIDSEFTAVRCPNGIEPDGIVLHPMKRGQDGWVEVNGFSVPRKWTFKKVRAG